MISAEDGLVGFLGFLLGLFEVGGLRLVVGSAPDNLVIVRAGDFKK